MEADAVTQQLDKEVLSFIQRDVHQPHDDTLFDPLALRLFAYQFERNAVYRGFCVGRGATPRTVAHWREIPAVPTLGFKEFPLACFPPERAAVAFLSSGTTGVKRSTHYLPTLALYEASLKVNFAAHILPERARMPMLILAHSARLLPQSSLTHMLEVVCREWGAPESDFYIDESGLQVARLAGSLRRAAEAGSPVCLLGTAFAFVHFLDHCQGKGLRFSLPEGSRIMDTGGYKGMAREVPKAELHQLYIDFLGVPPSHVVNEYGMTEMASQFYDNTLRYAVAGRGGPRFKLAPPWARTVVVDPETLLPLPEGEPGLLRHYDLANRGSVLAIQTDDLGYSTGEGFEVLGRASGAEARGCSIAMDEMLSQGGHTS